MRRPDLRRAGSLAVATVLTAALSGCLSLPDEGPVVESEVTGSGSGTSAMAINPIGPQPGQSATEIVKGFLDAMQATPIRTDVAREFLAQSSQSTWVPTATITYTETSLPRSGNRPGEVTVSLSGAVQIDSRGAWLGALGPAESERTFQVVREADEYRIVDPPDALIVPQSWFAQRFRQVSLYFFDPTELVLVPDPVFVPREVDLATILVRRLIAGPEDALQGFVRNAVPRGADPELTVPVSSGGIATVDLSGPQVTAPRAAEETLLLAQLAWTLRQDPSVSSVRVQVNGTDIDTGGPTSISAGARFAPYVVDASSLLYGLADGAVVEGAAPTLVPANGAFAQLGVPLRALALNLSATRAAGVVEDGTTLVTGPLVSDTEDDLPRAVWEGASDLLDPAWDFAGRLWAIDRTPDGAVVGYVPRLGRRADINVPGVSGQDVKNFLVSRDGSRLVAVIRGAKGDQVVVSRLLQNPAGRVVRALPAQQVDVEDGQGLRIRDVAWLTPTTVVVLHPVGGRLYRLRSASLDGAPASPDDLSLTLEGRISGLIGTPDPRLDTYAIAGRTLVHLTGPRGNDVELSQDLTDVGYVG